MDKSVKTDQELTAEFKENIIRRWIHDETSNCTRYWQMVQQGQNQNRPVIMYVPWKIAFTRISDLPEEWEIEFGTNPTVVNFKCTLRFKIGDFTSDFVHFDGRRIFIGFSDAGGVFTSTDKDRRTGIVSDVTYSISGSGQLHVKFEIAGTNICDTLIYNKN